jgi:hypothetical protein
MMDLTVLNKISTRVREDVLSLPKKDKGVLHIIGTGQAPTDILFQLQNNESFDWRLYKAVLDWKTKTVLWPEYLDWKWLMEKRNEIGEKAFEKEYQLTPSWSAESFFTREQILNVVNTELRGTRELKTKNEVCAGWDIGKHSHPSSFSVFEFVPIGSGEYIAVQRFQLWMDGWEYRKQLDMINHLMNSLRIDRVSFDNTRGEMEGFYEKGDMDKGIYIPIKFTTKSKHKIAAEFEKRVTHNDKKGDPSPTIQLLNDQRMINQILSVTNDLEAVETSEGHGDSFWSIGLALYSEKPAFYMDFV